MDDSQSVKSGISTFSQNTSYSTRSSIPIRMTRSQRLANEKRKQKQLLREKREKREKQHATELSRSKTNDKVSVKQRTTPRTILSNKKHKSIYEDQINRIKQNQHIETTSISNGSTLKINKMKRMKALQSKTTKELIHQMIDDFICICYIAHYSKLEIMYIKKDSKKTWNAQDVEDIPLANEEGCETWIERNKLKYPLTLMDLIIRGCFQEEIASSFPSVEVFRTSYLNKKTARRGILDGATLWQLFGSNVFDFSNLNKLNWNDIIIHYAKEQNVRLAKEECMKGNLDWGFCLLNIGKDNLRGV